MNQQLHELPRRNDQVFHPVITTFKAKVVLISPYAYWFSLPRGVANHCLSSDMKPITSPEGTAECKPCTKNTTNEAIVNTILFKRYYYLLSNAAAYYPY